MWGSRPEEVAERYPCDGTLRPPYVELYRAVDVPASDERTFRWLCQLRVAPYSYDWIDNLGRTSPRRLTPGLERLEVGQRFMTIFRLISFEPDRHVTLLHRGLLGEVCVSYVVGAQRLKVKMLWRFPNAFLRWLLAWGDLVMMRKQLLTLKALATSPGPYPEASR